jgi:hypothetical protein
MQDGFIPNIKLFISWAAWRLCDSVTDLCTTTLLLHFTKKERDDVAFRDFIKTKVGAYRELASNKLASECEEQFYYIATILCIQRATSLNKEGINNA